MVWSAASGRTKEVVLLAQQHPGKLKVWHSLRHCRESCPSEQNAAVIACFSVLSDRILYTDGQRQRRVRGTHVFEPSDRCTHCTCFSGPTPRSSPLLCIHPLLLTEGRRIKVVSWTVILFEFRSVPISSNHSHQLRATKMRATRRRRRQMCTFAGICSVYNQSALVCRLSRVFLVSVICLQLRFDLSDLLAFVRMKHYAMALPNVPIEISSLSPLDAGWAAEIKRLQSMRSHFTWQRMFIQVICPCEEQWRDSGCANTF